MTGNPTIVPLAVFRSLNTNNWKIFVSGWWVPTRQGFISYKRLTSDNNEFTLRSDNIELLVMDFEEVLKSTILEALIEKVINVHNTNMNYPAISAFSKLITSEPESAALGIQLIISRVQSSNEWEVMQMLNLLEICIEGNCIPLVAEVGKFRFLNEMIKLVSPKYFGNTTPAIIKNKIIGLLKAWSLKYPKETKIKEVYEMLLQQDVAKCDVNTSPCVTNAGSSNSSKLSVEEDAEKSEMLRKLLRSNKPDDLKAANLLIKTMVKEKEEKEDLKLIENNTRLLSEMLSNVNPNSSLEDFQLIRELKETCVHMKPTLTYLISSSNKTSKESAELFDMNDFLNDTLLYYQQIMMEKRGAIAANSAFVQQTPETLRANNYNTTNSNAPALLDFGSLMDDNSHILPNTKYSQDQTNSSKSEPLETNKAESSVDTLKDIFNSTFTLLDDQRNNIDESAAPPPPQCKTIDSANLFQDLSALGKSLLESPKIEEMNTKFNITNSRNSPGAHESVNSDDDRLLGDLDELVNGHETTRPQTRNDCPEESNNFIEPLSEVFVSLVDIKTENSVKLTAFEAPKGIRVCIQLTKNKPRNDVSVFLVLANSQHSQILTNFVFQPVVPKDCRLKVQPPSRTELPPYNPYLPTDTIVQIMLIASGKKQYIPLKFVISYHIQDEMITEMGEVSRLPLE